MVIDIYIDSGVTFAHSIVSPEAETMLCQSQHQVTVFVLHKIACCGWCSETAVVAVSMQPGENSILKDTSSDLRIDCNKLADICLLTVYLC